jgi:hypothetical protein
VWGRAADDAVTVTGDPTRIDPLRKLFTLVAQ